MVSAPLIADYIIGSSERRLTPMQVNKLSYIAHGFTLAMTNKPLFSDKVEAWRYGPVIPTLYHELKGFGRKLIDVLPYCKTGLDDPGLVKRLAFTSSAIPKPHQHVVDQVLEVYGDWSAAGLSTKTHEKGSPWDECYRPGVRGIEIPNTVTQRYYKEQLV